MPSVRWNTSSTPDLYFFASWVSRTNDCTVWIAPIDSWTSPATLASWSWTSRVFLRITRPKNTVAITIGGTIVKMIAVSRASMKNRIARSGDARRRPSSRDDGKGG